MYSNNIVYYRGETYEFKDSVSALRCRLDLADEDNPYASPENYGGTKVNETISSYSNHLDDSSYTCSKPNYINIVKTIEMPFLNKDRDSIITEVKAKLKEIDTLLSKLSKL